jgi:hypothetical protein
MWQRTATAEFTVPRSVLPVHLPASSRKATASPQTSQVRHTKILPAMQLQQGSAFRGCSHYIMFRLPRSLDPQVAPTAEVLTLQVGRAVYTTHSSVGYLPRDVASLRIRHEQLIRLDFHQLDCSLFGCSDVPSFAPAGRPSVTKTPTISDNLDLNVFSFDEPITIC